MTMSSDCPGRGERARKCVCQYSSQHGHTVKCNSKMDTEFVSRMLTKIYEPEYRRTKSDIVDDFILCHKSTRKQNFRLFPMHEFDLIESEERKKQTAFKAGLYELEINDLFLSFFGRFRTMVTRRYCHKDRYRKFRSIRTACDAHFDQQHRLFTMLNRKTKRKSMRLKWTTRRNRAKERKFFLFFFKSSAGRENNFVRQSFDINLVLARSSATVAFYLRDNAYCFLCCTRRQWRSRTGRRKRAVVEQ